MTDKELIKLTYQQVEAMQQAMEALKESIDVPCYGGHPRQEAAYHALREALNAPLAEQPAQRCLLCNYQHGHAIGCKNNPLDIALNKMAENARELRLDYEPAQQEPVAWADECRIELVNAIHFLASDFENALGAFGGDTEARRKAEGDIAHARSIASRWNWNGTSPPAQRKPLTDEEIERIYDRYGGNMMNCTRAIERAHGIKENT